MSTKQACDKRLPICEGCVATWSGPLDVDAMNRAMDVACDRCRRAYEEGRKYERNSLPFDEITDEPPTHPDDRMG